MLRSEKITPDHWKASGFQCGEESVEWANPSWVAFHRLQMEPAQHQIDCM